MIEVYSNFTDDVSAPVAVMVHARATDPLNQGAVIVHEFGAAQVISVLALFSCKNVKSTSDIAKFSIISKKLTIEVMTYFVFAFFSFR